MAEQRKLPERANGRLRPEESRFPVRNIVIILLDLVRASEEYPRFVFIGLALCAVAAIVSKPENMWGPVTVTVVSFIVMLIYMILNRRKL